MTAHTWRRYGSQSRSTRREEAAPGSFLNAFGRELAVRYGKDWKRRRTGHPGGFDKEGRILLWGYRRGSVAGESAIEGWRT